MKSCPRARLTRCSSIWSNAIPARCVFSPGRSSKSPPPAPRNDSSPPPETLARLAAQLRPQEKIQEIQPKKQEENRGKKTISPSAFVSPRHVGRDCRCLCSRNLADWLASESSVRHLRRRTARSAPRRPVQRCRAEVISTDRHTVKPWFQGKLPFSFNLPETLPADTSLTGGDLAYLHGQPAALLLFTIHKHEVSVFLTHLSESPVDTVPPGARSGFTIRHAVTRDLRILAVSDVNPAELDLLVSALVAAQAPALVAHPSDERQSKS